MCDIPQGNGKVHPGVWPSNHQVIRLVKTCSYPIKFLKIYQYGDNNLLYFLFTGLGEFFRQGKHYRKDYIKSVIEKLKRIDNWFSKQRRYSFYASSLLIVYNASMDSPQSQDIVLCSSHQDSQNTKYQHSPGMESTSCVVCNQDNRDRSFVDVRMIDFTHVFSSESEKDENYIFGLQNLIKHLESLLEL